MAANVEATRVNMSATAAAAPVGSPVNGLSAAGARLPRKPRTALEHAIVVAARLGVRAEEVRPASSGGYEFELPAGPDSVGNGHGRDGIDLCGYDRGADVEEPADAVIPVWTLGDRLRKARKLAGLRQPDLSARLDDRLPGNAVGTSHRSLNRYEVGETRPPEHVVAAWAEVTGVDQEWLQGTQPSDSVIGPEWTLQDRLRKARKHAGLKLPEVAERIDGRLHGASHRSLNRYEVGETQPPEHIVAAWAEVTGVDQEWLQGTQPADASGETANRRGEAAVVPGTAGPQRGLMY